MKKYTLITGASRGIGRAFAEECASRKMNLALVSLPNEDLPETSAELAKKYNVDVKYYEGDLAEEAAAQNIFDWCKSESLDVNMLINNAGLGSVGSFKDAGYKIHTIMLNLNMETPWKLIKLFLPDLLKQKEAWILNNASLAFAFPMPYKGTYAATKAFMYYFSMALSKELKEDNIHVSCLAPSAVYTSPAVRARIKAAGAAARWGALEPEAVAKEGMNGLMRHKKLIIPGFFNRFTYFISRMTPLSLNMSFAANKFKKKPEGQ